MAFIEPYPGQGGSGTWMGPRKPNRSSGYPGSQERALDAPPPCRRIPLSPFPVQGGLTEADQYGGEGERGKAICLIMPIIHRLIEFM